MHQSSDFWDALAPHHWSLENNYLDVRSVRHIAAEIVQPVLVVGAGQGLIVEELRKRGLQCDGVDLSHEMIRYARTRRGINLIEADARALPLAAGRYETIIYATGVIDFIADEELIGLMLKEGRRVATARGRIFVAFYRMNRKLEELLIRVELLQNETLSFRQVLAMYQMNAAQMLAWITKRAGAGRLRAAAMLIRAAASLTMQERRASSKMRKVFRNAASADALLKSAPPTQPYRDERAIRNLFARLMIPIEALHKLKSCYIVSLGRRES